MSRVSSFRHVDRSPERDQLHVRFKEDDGRVKKESDPLRKASARNNATINDNLPSKNREADSKDDRTVDENIRADLRYLPRKVDRTESDDTKENEYMSDSSAKMPSGEEKQDDVSGNESEASNLDAAAPKDDALHYHDNFDIRILNLDEDSKRYFNFFHLLESIENGCLMKTKKGVAGDAPSQDNFSMFAKMRFWMTLSWGVDIPRDDWSICFFTDQLSANDNSKNTKNTVKAMPIREISEVYLDPKTVSSLRIYRGREVIELSPQETELTAPRWADAISALLQLHSDSTELDILQQYYLTYREFIQASPQSSPKKTENESRSKVIHKRSTLFVKMKQIFKSASNISNISGLEEPVRRWSFSRSKSTNDTSNIDFSPTQQQETENTPKQEVKNNDKSDENQESATHAEATDFLSQSSSDFHQPLRPTTSSQDSNDNDDHPTISTGKGRHSRSGSESDGNIVSSGSRGRPVKQLSTVMRSSMESMGSFLGLTPTVPTTGHSYPNNEEEEEEEVLVDDSIHSQQCFDKVNAMPKAPAEELGRVTVLDMMYQKTLEHKQNRSLYTRYHSQAKERQYNEEGIELEHEQYRRYQQHVEEITRLQTRKSSSISAINSKAVSVDRSNRRDEKLVSSPKPQQQQMQGMSFAELKKNHSHINIPSPNTTTTTKVGAVSSGNITSPVTISNAAAKNTKDSSNKSPTSPSQASPSLNTNREQQLTDFLLGKSKSPTSPILSPSPRQAQLSNNNTKTLNEKAKKGYFQRTFSGFTSGNTTANNNALSRQQNAHVKSPSTMMLKHNLSSSADSGSGSSNGESDNGRQPTTAVSVMGKKATPLHTHATSKKSVEKNVYTRHDSYVSSAADNKQKRSAMVTNIDHGKETHVNEEESEERESLQQCSSQSSQEQTQDQEQEIESNSASLPFVDTTTASRPRASQSQSPVRTSTASNYGHKLQQLFQGMPPSQRGNLVVSPTNLTTLRNEFIAAKSNDRSEKDSIVSPVEAMRRESMRRTSLILSQYNQSPPSPSSANTLKTANKKDTEEVQEVEDNNKEDMPVTKTLLVLYNNHIITLSLCSKDEVKAQLLTSSSSYLVPTRRGLSLSPLRRRPGELEAATKMMSVIAAELLESEYYLCFATSQQQAEREEYFFVPLQAMVVLQVDTARSGLFRMALAVQQKRKYACIQLRSTRSKKASIFATLAEVAGLVTSGKKMTRKGQEKWMECLFEAQAVEELPAWLHTVIQVHSKVKK